MTLNLPPLDLHAHIDVEADPRELERLGAVIFAATRSVEEFQRTEDRRDQVTIWGVGCHPGLVGAQHDYSANTFAEAITRTPYVSEVGIDVSSRVPMRMQQATFESILAILAMEPRLAAIHSYGATGSVIEAIESHRAQGAVLHWWLGTRDETIRAVAAGCYFSINYSMVQKFKHLSIIPKDRLLVETDHPAGDRFSPHPRQPGHVQPVETVLAKRLSQSETDVRNYIWRNFARLTGSLDLIRMMPDPVQRMLRAAGTNYPARQVDDQAGDGDA